VNEILKLENVVKCYESLRAVDGVSLSIKEGSVIGLIGPNGSGKSTLFNVISGLDRANEGKIWFRGIRIENLPPHKIFSLGLVKSFQDPRLFLGMTVLDNMLVPPKGQKGESPVIAPLHSKWRDQEIALATKASELLEKLLLKGLHKTLSAEISGGQMKLLEMGRTLMAEPRMLLLDEPTAGVAPKLARDIFERLLKLREEFNLTLFIIEHRLEVLFDYVEYVYVMHRGKILAEGKPDDILYNKVVAEVYLGG
jgi:branched-chain amino acid transport system ATP-binding protein